MPDILIIDDEKDTCTVIGDFLITLGYNCICAYSAENAIELLKKKPPALVLCDIKMPGVDGIEFLRQLRALDANLPIIMMSGVGTHERVIKCLEVGATDFIAKPFNFDNLKSTIRRLIGDTEKVIKANGLSPVEKILKHSCLDMLTALAAAQDAKDPYMRGHSERIKQYAVKIARAMQLPNDEIEVLEYAAILHDIGKIAVSDVILQKPGKLTAEEMDIVKKHPLVGSDILSQLTILRSEQPIVRHHHERFDGKGYPDGLKKEQIPLGARILCVADSFDAMTSKRPYRDSLTIEQAQKELDRCKGAQFDPAIVEAFKGNKT